jgi:hypothetical protein
MNNLYEVIVDGSKFFISSKILSRSPILSNIIQSKKSHDTIFIDGNKIVIDCDPSSFSFIVDVLRGYNPNLIYITEPGLKNKIRRDFSVFGLDIKLHDESDIGDMLEETKKEFFETIDLDLDMEGQTGGFNDQDIKSIVQETNEQLKLGNIDIINKVSNNQNIQEMIKNSFPEEKPSPENSDEELIDLDSEDNQDGGFLVSCSSHVSTRYVKIN